MTVYPNQSDMPADNAVDRLADLFDAMETHVKSADRAVRRSEGNRIGILYVHAVYALLIAPAFAALGRKGMTGTIWAVMRQIPGAPYSLAMVMFLGGLVLTVATTFRSRPWEIAGLALLILWYGTVAASFAAAIMMWVFSDHRAPQPSLYAPLVYSHFLTIMLVHCYTLRRMLRDTGQRR